MAGTSEQEKVDEFLRCVMDFNHRVEPDDNSDSEIQFYELHHRSESGIDLKFGSGISCKQYCQYMDELDPSLAIVYKSYKRCSPVWCTWSSCGSSESCCRLYYCTPHFGVPKPWIYWFLNMFISAIALALEADFLGLVYNIQNGAFKSDNQIIKMACIWATAAYFLTNITLIFTIEKCLDGHWGKKSCFEGETCLAVCPVVNVGASETIHYPGTVERFHAIRIRWWMLTPFTRLIFVLAVNGNADVKHSSKTMETMRQEKTTNFRSMAIIGMLNTFTVTMPNMLMGYFSLQDNGGFQGGNVMDSIFFYVSCFSFVLTMISMCFGILDAVVHTIDYMDTLLNKVQEAEEHQNKCIKFAKWHLDELADVCHYVHMALYALKQDSARMFRPRAKALLKAMKNHIPEDDQMLHFKNELMRKIDPDGAKLDVKAYAKFSDDEREEWKIEILEYYSQLEWWMQKYMKDLRKSCVIAKMPHHLILEKYQTLLEKREKVEKIQLNDLSSLHNRDQETEELQTERVRKIYNSGGASRNPETDRSGGGNSI